MEYLQNVIGDIDRIYMDTSSLMNDHIEAFIKQIELLLIWNNKKINIPKQVQMELVRHTNSKDKMKCMKAKKALSLIEKNTIIFNPQCEDISKIQLSDCRYAFADIDILIKLIKKRYKNSILLITNDFHLAQDAYKLNELESCDGKLLKVAYIKDGKLEEIVLNKQEYSLKELFEMMKKAVYKEILTWIRPIRIQQLCQRLTMWLF